MKIAISRATFWAALLIVADVVVAATAAVSLWFVFGVFYVAETLPPICSTYFGRRVDCGLDTRLRVGEWSLFVLFLAALLCFQLGRMRRDRGARADLQ